MDSGVIFVSKQECSLALFTRIGRSPARQIEHTLCGISINKSRL